MTDDVIKRKLIQADYNKRIEFLRYKKENGLLYRQYDMLVAGKVTVSYCFQEDADIAPQVGDETLRCRVLDLGNDDQQILYDIVILTQEILDATDPIANLAPTNIALSGNTLSEQDGIGTVVGILSTFDPNIGDTHTYSITTDLDDKFEIIGNNLRLKNLLDFDTATQHEVLVRSTDQGSLFFEKLFTIFVQEQVGFVNDKATRFLGETIDQDMTGPAANIILPSNGSFSIVANVKKDDPAPFNEIETYINGTTQFLSAPFNASFAGKTKLSMDGWITIDRTTGEQVIASHFGASGSRGFRFSILSGKLYFNVSQNGLTQETFIGATPLVIGTRYHLAFAFDGAANTVKTWINAVIETNAVTTYNSINGPNIPLRVGARGDSSIPQTSFLNGLIDELSLHNDALITASIVEKYNLGNALDVRELGSSSSLVSFWRMGDQDVHPTVIDHVGPNNLTMQNMSQSNFVLLGGAAVPVLPDKTLITIGSVASITYNQKEKIKVKYLNGVTPLELLFQDITHSNGEYKNIIVKYSLLDSKIELFINGVLKGSSSPVTLPSRDTSIVRIAGDSDQTDFLDATVDEVSIFDTAVDVAEIFNNGIAQDILANESLPTPRLWLRMGDLPDDFIVAGGIKDKSGNGHDFTANNMSSSNCVFDALPIIPAFADTLSLPLNGLDHRVDLPSNNVQFDFADPFSLSMWIKYNIGGGTSTATIMGNMHNPNTALSTVYQGYRLRNTGTRRPGFQFITNNGASFTQINIDAIGSLSVGVWYHICATYDGTTDASGMKLHVNGAVVSHTTPNNTAPNGTLSGTNDLSLGARFDLPSSPTQFLGALLNEPSVWNKELSLLEVQEIYNAGSPSDLGTHSAVANLKLWYGLGDVVGDDETKVGDRLALNTDGTLINFNPNPYSVDVP